MKKDSYIRLGLATLTTLILLFTNRVSMAQPFCNYAKSTNGTENERGNSVTVDASGNIYTTGSFSSPTITFGSYTLTNSDNSGNSTDFFIVKQDSCGTFLWAKSAGEKYYDDWGSAITTDKFGNVFVCGAFISYSITFGSYTLSPDSTVSQSAFIVKYSPSGIVKWAKNSSARKGGTRPNDLETEQNGGAVYMTGSFSSDTLKFDTIEIYDNKGNGDGYDDIFTTKYDSIGNIIWARSEGYSSSDEANGIAVDKFNNVFITGSFGDSLTIGSTTIHSYSYYDDIFLAKYSSNGSPIWLKGAGRYNSDVANDVEVDAYGNTFLTGYFYSDTLQFDQVSIVSTAFERNGFIAKFDPSGNCLWGKRMGGTVEDYGKHLAADTNNNVFVVGCFFSPSITFDSITLDNATGVDSTADLFLAKYDTDGNALWAKRAGGLRDDYAKGVAVGKNNAAVIVGDYKSSSIQFGATTLTNNGNLDLYIANNITQNDVPVPQICAVTVDSLSEFNIIAWDKTPFAGASERKQNFIVYRETSTNTYNPIAVIPFDSLSLFIDTVRVKYFPNTGNPNKGTYRYKIQLQDSFGNYSLLSPYHNTIFIVDNGSGSFTWNPGYTIEGASNPVNNYVLMRDNLGDGNWTTVGSISGSQNTIADNQYSSYPNGKWRVETDWSLTCTPSIIKKSNPKEDKVQTQVVITKSASNIRHNFVLGVNEKDMNAFISVYPNPANGSLFVEWSENMNSTTQQVIVRNYLGVEVSRTISTKNQSKILLDVSGLASGIYSVEVKGDKYNAVKRVIVE